MSEDAFELWRAIVDGVRERVTTLALTVALKAAPPVFRACLAPLVALGTHRYRRHLENLSKAMRDRREAELAREREP